MINASSVIPADCKTCGQPVIRPKMWCSDRCYFKDEYPEYGEYQYHCKQCLNRLTRFSPSAEELVCCEVVMEVKEVK